jgi:hypothetical protein
MLDIPEGDVTYLKNKISLAEVILVLGAGAVRDCKNARGDALKLADKLAEELCTAEDNGESLGIVLDALKLTTPQLNTRLVHEYQGCSASDDLKAAFSVPWRRVYTFNIDDSIETLGSILSKQNIFSYNGMHAKVTPYEGPRVLHVVHLNGYVRELDKGVIFSKTDYDKRLSQPDAVWYREAAEDNFRYCSIFIGTRLNEPLLWSEIERRLRPLIRGASHQKMEIRRVQAGDGHVAWRRWRGSGKSARRGITPRCRLHKRIEHRLQIVPQFSRASASGGRHKRVTRHEYAKAPITADPF